MNKIRSFLDLEGLALPAATSTLELAATGENVRSLVLVGAESEVTDGLASTTRASEKEGVRTGRGTTGELVEGDGLAASLDDASTGALSETQSSNGDLLGGLDQAVVISDSADDDNGLAVGTRALHSTVDAGNRDRRAVGLRKEELSENDLVELGVRATSKEAVKLHKQTQVRVLRCRLLAVAATVVGLAEVVDSHWYLWSEEVSLG